MKIYELYGAPGDVPSSNSRDYNGHIVKVVANNAAQAKHFVTSEKWIANIDNPVGIIEYYNKWIDNGGDHLLWDGCRIFGGLNISHGDSEKKTVQALAKHSHV